LTPQMNIIYSLLHTFFQEESTYVLFMILTSFLINILQTNGIGFITSNIIQSVQNKNAALSLQLLELRDYPEKENRHLRNYY
jgi:hypothetical protein